MSARLEGRVARLEALLALCLAARGSGGGGGGGGPQTISVPTGGMGGSGQAAYLAGGGATPTDRAAIASSVMVGVYEGAAGKVQIDGLVPDALFTTAGGAPVSGQRVWLAAASDDGGTAAGKFTATAPTGPIGSCIAWVAICVDASAYAGSKRASVVLTVGGELAEF